MIRRDSFHRSRRSATRPWLLGAVFALAFTMLAVQALRGERGLFAWYELARQAEQVEAQHARLAADNALLVARIARLSGDTLDLDFLDERARRILGLVHPDDRVIIY